MTSPATWLRRFTAATTAGGLLLVGVPALEGYAVPAEDARAELVLTSAAHHHEKHHHKKHHAKRHRHGRHHHRHAGRRIVRYTVRPGDTATGLAVRFHAWTDELLAINDLGPHATLYVGERIRIPVVHAAARKARHHGHATRHRHHHRRPHHGTKHGTNHRSHHRAHHKKHAEGDRPSAHHPPRALPHPSRAKVRRVIVRTARRHGVPVNLALAIAWQEAGWQMHLVSSANAIGAMQVLPSTGRWLSGVVGRRLQLRRLHDNVTAGVLLIKILRQSAGRRRAVAGYYQGLASVREHGMYADTRRYVRSVLSLQRSLRGGWRPV